MCFWPVVGLGKRAILNCTHALQSQYSDLSDPCRSFSVVPFRTRVATTTSGHQSVAECSLSDKNEFTNKRHAKIRKEISASRAKYLYANRVLTSPHKLKLWCSMIVSFGTNIPQENRSGNSILHHICVLNKR